MSFARTSILNPSEYEMDTLDMKTNEPTHGRALLLEILGWARPHGSECEQRFAREYLDKVPGMQTDGFGNRSIRIGDSNVLWSCHIDTVARYGGPQEIKLDVATGIISLKDGKKKCSLGADDGTGVWIMLEMIRYKRPGLYIFHRGEEHGCLGSRYIAADEPHQLRGIEIAVAFDRAGYSDVITHQASGRTCSDDFAHSFAAQLNEHGRLLAYRPDDTGVYTDTNEYAELVAECSNISVGYYGQHSHKETQDLYHAEQLLEAVLSLDISKLVVKREPGDIELGYPSYMHTYHGAVNATGRSTGRDWRDDEDTRSSRRTTGNRGDWSRLGTTLDEMAEIVSEYPYTVAAILMGKGMDPEELWSEIIDADELQARTSDVDEDSSDYDAGERPRLAVTV